MPSAKAREHIALRFDQLALGERGLVSARSMHGRRQTRTWITAACLIALVELYQGAAVAVAAVDVTGTWGLTITVSGPVDCPKLDFVQSGASFSADSDPTFDPCNIHLAGTINAATGAFSATASAFGCTNVGLSGGVAIDSSTFSATFNGCSVSGTVTGLRRCGNGVADPGEQCEDGNFVGGDCCDPFCEPEPPGVCPRSPLVSFPGAIPWPMFSHDASRTSRGLVGGPDDAAVLGPPWPFVVRRPIGGSPAIDSDGTAYFGANNGVFYAVDRTGQQRWTFTAGGPISSSAAIGRPVDGPASIYFGAGDGQLYSLTSAGGLSWAFQPGSPPNQTALGSSPAVTKDPVSGANRIYVVADDGTLYAVFERGPLSPVTEWQFSGVKPRTSVALSEDREVVYAVSDVSPFFLHCLDAATGRPVNLSPVSFPSSTNLTMPVVIGGQVLVSDGKLRALPEKCTSEKPIWDFALPDPITIPPAIGNDSILILTNGTLSSISKGGTFQWGQSFAEDLAPNSPITDAAGTAYLMSKKGGKAFAVTKVPNASGGRLLWELEVPGVASKLPNTLALDGDGRVHVTTDSLDIIDDVPAFQVAYDSNELAANLDVYSLREQYGLVDPGRKRRLTTAPSDDEQPAYSLDRGLMAFVSAAAGSSQDVHLANAMGADEANVTTWAPFSTASDETEPAFTAIDDRTGISRLADRKRYTAMTSDTSGVRQIYFLDIGSYLSTGQRMVSSFTQWASNQGVPNSITSLLEDPTIREQSQAAFSPDGRKMAYRDCDLTARFGVVKLLTLDGAQSQWGDASPAVPIETGQPCFDFSPSFSPDSRWLVMSQADKLVIYDTAGPTPPIFVNPIPGALLRHPNWAPDGGEIAAASVNNGTPMVVARIGPSFGTEQTLATARSDEPYFSYWKFPQPIGFRLRNGAFGQPDKQFPGETIEILGRGFDILHRDDNKVFFQHTQAGGPMLQASVVAAEVDPVAGLGVLRVVVPDFAGNGPVRVETRFGRSDCCSFTVLPKATKVVQRRTIPGAKVRIFGLGFDLKGLSNRVKISRPSGSFVEGRVLSGEVSGSEQFLIVEMPHDFDVTGFIEVTAGGFGTTCTTPACYMEPLHPTLTFLRADPAAWGVGGRHLLSQYRSQGCDGVDVEVEAKDFPYDPFFGYGSKMKLEVKPWQQVVEAVKLPGDDHQFFDLFPLSFPNDDTVGTLIPQRGKFPSRPTGYDHVGELHVWATDQNLTPMINGSPDPIAEAVFRVPLRNIPIIFVPGTSGNSLDLTSGFLSYGFLGDVHSFEWLCTACALSPVAHLPHTFTYSGDPRGPQVWIGAELVNNVLINTPGIGGNHYLDVLGFNGTGAPLFPQIVPGSVFRWLTFPGFMGGVCGTPVYDELIAFLTGTGDSLGCTGSVPMNNLGRPLAVGATGASNGLYLFPYDFRADMSTEAARLNSFVDAVLGQANLQAAGINKVVLITHSLGGPLSRAFYLRNPQKVDQMISLGGGFLGVPKPVKILMMGDNWGTGWGSGGFSVGIAEWEMKNLAQNWGTAYFQAPNSESWFSDDGVIQANGVRKNRSYIRDGRIGLGLHGEQHSFAASQSWLRQNHNTTITDRATAFFAGLPAELGDFRNGTGGVFHHRIIGQGRMDTTVAGVLYLGPADTCLCALASLTDPTLRIACGDPVLECPPRVKPAVVYGDGDTTVTYHGALGLTDPGDDRVYILQAGQSAGITAEHLDLMKFVESHDLIASMLNGSVCSQTQQAVYRSQEFVAESVPRATTRTDAAPTNGIRHTARAQTLGQAAAGLFVELRGSAQLDITDDQGRHVGPLSNAQRAGLSELGIPGATYDAGAMPNRPGLGFGAAFLGVPDNYTIQLTGLTPTGATLRVTAFTTGDDPPRTFVFQGIPLIEGSTAGVRYDMAAPSPLPTLYVRHPGRAGHTAIHPSVLDPVQASDEDTPKTVIQRVRGQAVVTATDAGSGVLRTYYTTDARDFRVYEGPQRVSSDAAIVMAFSVDRNGNMEYPGATLPVLRVSRSAVSVSGRIGHPIAPRKVRVLNPDPIGVTAQLAFTAQSNVQWVSANPSSGMTPERIFLFFDTAGLPPGIHTGVVTVRSSTPNTVFSRRLIKVVLTLTD